ncbi:MAG: Uma2 family endonuclease [Planctomycetes bacterium]|nr:Uma2 family endonuclease [Planctomycetota bacterium]
MRLSLPYAPETPDFVDTPQGRKAVPERMTVREFLDFGFEEKQHWELIGGVPVMSPAPNYNHQRLVLALALFVNDACERKRGLEMVQDVDILFAGDPDPDWLRPDIVVVRGKEVGDGRMPLRTLPQLIVEVWSPSTGGRDHGIKREVYARAGVPEYWIADPATGSLAVFHKPSAEGFDQQPADKDGFVISPFIAKALRIQRNGSKYRVLTK